MGSNSAALTERQRRFVEEYLVDLNGTQAAIRAGYSKASAADLAYQTLRKPAVAAAIDRALGRAVSVSRSRVVEELAAIAFADAGDFFTWGPDGVTVRDSRDLPADRTRVVAEISESRTGTGGTIRLKLADKLAALEKLGRALGLFRERLPAADDPDTERVADTRELAKAVMAILSTAHTGRDTGPADDQKGMNDGRHSDDADNL